MVRSIFNSQERARKAVLSAVSELLDLISLHADRFETDEEKAAEIKNLDRTLERFLYENFHYLDG